MDIFSTVLKNRPNKGVGIGRSSAKRTGKAIAPKLAIGKSKIDRIGIFASRPIQKGEVVYSLTGREVTIEEIEQIYVKGLTRISTDGFQLSGKGYLYLDAFSVSGNHSCNPNCGVTGKSTLVALRDIAAGEEITYDYSTTEWTPRDYILYDYREWPMQCRCSETKCRKLITCFPYLPKGISKDYISSGILPDHIKRKLKQPGKAAHCDVCEHALRAHNTKKRAVQ